MDKLWDALADVLLGIGPDRALVIILLLGYFPLAATIKALFELYKNSMEARVADQAATQEILNDLTRVVERVADVVKVTMK